jgi:hypothetical protein
MIHLLGLLPRCQLHTRLKILKMILLSAAGMMSVRRKELELLRLGLRLRFCRI